METRDLEVRLAADEAGTIAGYAALWDRPDSFGDVLVRGAFSTTLAAHRMDGTRPLMLWAHDPSRPIGTWEEIREDDRGLNVSGRLVMDSTAGRDAHALIRAGAVNGLSIGFRTVKAAPLPKGGRRVSAVDLIEVSPVTRPAQAAARITSVRSIPAAAGLAAFIRERAALLRSKA